MGGEGTDVTDVGVGLGVGEAIFTEGTCTGAGANDGVGNGVGTFSHVFILD